MRLQELSYIVNHACKTWIDPEFDEKTSNGQTISIRCKNAEKMVMLLEPLKPFPEINRHIEEIYSTHDTFYKGAPGSLTLREKNIIISAMSKIKENLLAMQSICAALGLEHGSVGFDVKLPPNITLGELSSCTKDLDHVFSQCPLLQNEGEKIRLSGVDVGSMWLTFAVVCAGAAATFYITNNLAAMVEKVIAIREHIAVLKQQEELARQASLKNEMLETIVAANVEIGKKLIEEATNDLAEKNGVSDKEDIERIRGSLSMLKGWIDKGMEVYAAIDAPEEIKAVFPPAEIQSLPDISHKRISAHTEESEM